MINVVSKYDIYKHACVHVIPKSAPQKARSVALRIQNREHCSFLKKIYRQTYKDRVRQADRRIKLIMFGGIFLLNPRDE